MPLNLRERQVHAVARRYGLKLIFDRHGVRQTGRERYYLRPIWDARHAVRVLPGGGYDLVLVTRKRRHVASPLPLDDVELLLTRWPEPTGGQSRPESALAPDFGASTVVVHQTHGGPARRV